MEQSPPSLGFRRKLLNLAASIGPGIFLIGYIIGTGSVTSMAKAGSEYGLSLTWALALSCFSTYVLVIAVSRVTIISGRTLIYCIRERFGSAIAIFVIVGLMATVVTSVMGVMGIAADVVGVWSGQLFDGWAIPPLATAIAFNAILYVLFWNGSHRVFTRGMAVIVAVMSASFVTTMMLTIPEPAEFLASLQPALPEGSNAHLALAAMVGTTMAGVCVVARTYLVAEQRWTLSDLKTANWDAILSLSLTFLVSAAIMASAAATMKPHGYRVDQAIDMVKTLEPLAGRFATALFVSGIIAAALSSLFPNYLLGPWLICDYLNAPRQMDRAVIRCGVAAVASLAFVVPIFGGRPVAVMIASQAISPVVMPLLVVLLLIQLHSKRIVGEYRNPRLLDLGLVLTFAFSMFAFYSAVLGLIDEVRQHFPAVTSQ